ncbi:MAG TPA: carbohydrate kinase family protein, partial [Methanosarcinales archaeon]|nr:carbohydrate kinase family protein [Methanosarcinales archaeon]
MKSKITCTVIGDAMVDLVFPLSNNNDVKYIMQGGVTSTKSKITLGGTANVAFWISKLGCNSAFIGKIGNDCFGNYIKKDLRVNKIKDGLAISSEYNTGLVIVLVLPTKERFFIVDRGANIDLKMQDVNFDFCLNSKYLYICGYSFQDK